MREAMVAAAAVLAGCVSVGSTVLLPGLPETTDDQVAVYLPGDSVPPHQRVAIFEADYNNWSNDATDVIDKFRSEAAKVGASGVVILGSQAESDATRATRALLTGVDLGSRVKVQAVAILTTP